jgi:hypothetical protein
MNVCIFSWHVCLSVCLARFSSTSTSTSIHQRDRTTTTRPHPLLPFPFPPLSRQPSLKPSAMPKETRVGLGPDATSTYYTTRHYGASAPWTEVLRLGWQFYLLNDGDSTAWQSVRWRGGPCVALQGGLEGGMGGRMRCRGIFACLCSACRGGCETGHVFYGGRCHMFGEARPGSGIWERERAVRSFVPEPSGQHAPLDGVDRCLDEGHLAALWCRQDEWVRWDAWMQVSRDV